jgi:hypothetical protein
MVTPFCATTWGAAEKRGLDPVLGFSPGGKIANVRVRSVPGFDCNEPTVVLSLLAATSILSSSWFYREMFSVKPRVPTYLITLSSE